MTSRRTNKGQAVDIQSLALANEQAVAVGNMKVNARGDQLDNKGNIVKTKTEQAQAYYQNNPKAAVKTVSIKDAVDVSATKEMEQTPVAEKPKAAPKASKPAKAKQPKMKEVELPNGDIELVEDTEE
tara:strand:+ start:10099 stop:10479 length:381 start_codon:yes stop_codon:yes gene_type:complete